ncbi:branched-chain amino acid ABC transporter substrate-binding protein [Chryseobacterium culicis]|uniref:Branched-chain amino acid ABC transporter substrate-binding protein n=1 Tax=Chryseobacterium culicis TaxID=680127 RepID=A0A2S9CHX4_CHRCI|nr:branched-chain amino acid ABC transporter substrate-binding protein [Chryseobacterium culicis]PRB80073.1 branched-chain amino acid ABC transporter substrate-binding protein [Chryseobacterium culicis]PRB87323.1 branched-chain amino acid ABC transporter substrate-binding protein [Chryseobacterium culicis]
MSWNFLDVFDVVLNGLELLGSRSRSTSDRESLNYDEKPGKKESKRSRYFTEKVSVVLMVLAAFSFFIVFKDPLPVENYTQTLVVTSLIGVGISFVVFFILHVMELYYFKSIFKLLLFSCSVMGFFISVVMYIYFRSGWFI